MTFAISTLARRVKKLMSADPVPCWTDYLRAKGGFRG